MNKKISKITALHYVKLAARSVVLILSAAAYIIYGADFTARFAVPVFCLWLIYIIEMILRHFPSELESAGSQKQFAKNYIPQSGNPPRDGKKIILTAAVWLAFNACFGALYLRGVIDRGVIILISLAYAVCDMICVLYFCPFQKWLPGTRCCSTCRIYNWDYLMMFTPLVFIGGFYAWSLLFFAAILTARWEVTAYRHREWFYNETNAKLSCVNCKEKRCRR